MDETYSRGPDKRRQETKEVPEVLGNIVLWILAFCIILLLLGGTSAVLWFLFKISTGS